MRRDEPRPFGVPALVRGAIAAQQVRNGVALRIALDEQIMDFAELDYAGNENRLVTINPTGTGLNLAPAAPAVVDSDYGDIVISGGTWTFDPSVVTAFARTFLDDPNEDSVLATLGAEASIAAGTIAQYWRGDKSWQTLNKAAVGLSNVDDTSDAGKPISTAQQTALDLKAPLASPTFTGTPAAPTAAAVDNSTKLATTAFVQTAISDLIAMAPGTLNTLDELANALGDDPNFATTVTTNLAGKLVKTANLSDLVDATAARTNLGLVVGTDVQAQIAAGTTSQYYRGDKSWQTLDAAAISDFSETVDDRVGSLLVNGTNISLTYNDAGNALTIAFAETANTFIPQLLFGGGSAGMTMSTQAGYYVRFGPLVWIDVRITLTLKGSATGTATVSGLPFAAAAAPPSVRAVMACSHLLLAAVTAPGTATIAEGASAVTLQDFVSNTTVSLTDANFNNNSTIRFSGIYRV